MAYFRRSFRRFNREPTKITCAECGKEDTVPFKPREGSTVLCKECFLKKKGIVPKEEKPEAAEEEPEVVEEVEETEEIE
ncbi:MAG: CxxC-x17-CxxC domain-containing protein [Candidatus Pacearchaeota archaeon]